MNIVGTLRVKNEARWIQRVLESMKPVCSQIILLDDHSDDGSARIARSVEGVVVIESPFVGIDEARDREFLLGEAMNFKPDWILAIDGDEEIDPSVLPVIREMTERPVAPAYCAKILYLWDREDLIRVDGIYEQFWRPRLFKPSESDGRYTNLYGGMHCTCVPNDLNQRALRYPGFELKHWGYIDKEIRVTKYRWYNQADPNNENEDCYRHIVQGDLPEVPPEAKLKHAGPLRLRSYGSVVESAVVVKSDRPVFSLCHPSARPDKVAEIKRAWMLSADHPEEVEYVLCADKRWGFDESVYEHEDDQTKITFNTRRKCFVDSVNQAADISNGQVLICIADDQYPCLHWDTLLKSRLPIRDHVEFVAQVNTGTPSEVEREILVLPILSRARYERLGYVMFPGYESMFSDNDLYEHAVWDRCLIDCRELPMFPHKHPFFDKSLKIDSAYQHQNNFKAYEVGFSMLEIRKAHGFGDTSGHRGTIVVCTPGEHFTKEWVQAHDELMASLRKYFNVFPLYGYATNVFHSRSNMLSIIESMQPAPELVLWIDDDKIVTAQHVDWLIQSIRANPQLDAVAGWCLIRSEHRAEGWRMSCGLFTSEKNGTDVDFRSFIEWPTDCVPVHWTGFAVVLMKPSAIIKAGKNPFCPVLSDDHMFGFMGEDGSFWHHAHFRGHASIAVDKRVRVPHLKMYNECGPAEPEKKQEAKETVAA
jgi:hypothetical protein